MRNGGFFVHNLLIIQARMGSSRLPNKVLLNLCGKPMLQHIVERVGYCKEIDRVVVATTVNAEDDKIELLCNMLDIVCYRGSENDVLDRFYQAAGIYRPCNIVRITADCPLIDPEIIDNIVRKHVEGHYDYTSNTLVETYPDGLDTEIFTYNALQTAWEQANLASEREHVTPYIKFKGNFSRFSVEHKPSYAEKRWTVDTEKDFEKISQIYHALYKDNNIFLMDDILMFLQEHPEIELLNMNIMRNEGYQTSLANDYIIERNLK